MRAMTGVSTLYLPMRARIQKWGGSLALKIPKSAAIVAGLAQGTEVELKAGKGGLVVRPIPAKVYRLSDLLRNVRKSQLHGEVDFGPPVGKEVW